MRNYLIFAILWFLYHSSLAQPIQDSALYLTGMQMIDAALTESQYLDAAEFFESIVSEHESHWLAHYYAGLSYTLASHEIQDSKNRDLLIDKAQNEVDKALVLKPDEPEVLILHAFVFQARIQVDPVMRGLNYSTKANSMLQKALQADPENPRAQLLMAYNIYYTPAIFGGGAAKALPMFIEARDCFNTFKTESEFAPRWGIEETLQMIQLCTNESTGQQD